MPLMYAGAQHLLSNGTNLLQVSADSDYAGDETRRSTMGTVTMMNGGPISWCSVVTLDPGKKQMNILLLIDTTIEGASPSHARQE